MVKGITTVNYKIFQAPIEVEYVFRGYDLAKNKMDFKKDYREVYEDRICTECSSTVLTEQDRTALLEKIFSQFNMNRPTRYKGRSLSVSDIVSIDGFAYYCDDFGWTRIYIDED